MRAAENRPVPWLVVAGGIVAMLAILIRTAWLSDDAYITLRTVDNVVNGFGLRWNVAERVQSFTHPAWLFLITPIYALTREAFYTVLAVQMLIGLATVAVVLRSLARDAAGAILALSAFVGSKAFVEFSTSGLENPLAHLLLVGFLIRWLRDRSSPRELLGLGLLTSALLLCRLDLGVLVAPMLAAALWPLDRRRLVSFAYGLAPFVAWELFAFIYYGSLVPNTALAKLPPGVSFGELATQGLKYFAATFHFDPITPVVLFGALVSLLARGGGAGRIVGVGVGVHLVYVVCVGGDFMSGRFLTPAFVAAVGGALATVSLPRGATPRLAAAALLVGATLNSAGPLRTGAGFSAAGLSAEELDRHGVTDERRIYYPSLGFLRVFGGMTSPAGHPSADFVTKRRAEPRVNDAFEASVIGVAGYYAGPAVHIVDRNALADPLLARLPPRSGWRIGHFTREVPAGYLESCQRRENVIEDARIKTLYADVLLVTRAPLFSRERFAAMWRLF